MRDPEDKALASTPHLRVVRGGNEGPARAEARTCEHERASEHLSGTLQGAELEQWLAHLPSCAVCERALHLEVQLRDREDVLRQEAPAVDDLAKRRGRRQTGMLLALATAAAATTLWLLPRNHGSSKASSKLALAPHRSLEARLAWPGAASYRPYETMRAATRVIGEHIDPEAVAELSRRKDCAGLAAAYLLAGELNRAETQYRECPSSPDLDADRAALAVARGKADEALEFADRALAEQPDHPGALWNRALALRDLGLGLAAAATFESLAARGDDWQEEARTKAHALRSPLEAARVSWREALTLGKQMIPDGPVLPERLVQAVPARARMRFHDAVRTATTKERLEELRVLANQLERTTGDALGRYVDDALARLPRDRSELVPFYAQLVQGTLTPKARGWAAQWQRWQARAQALGADDLLLGAHYLVDGASGHTERLAKASGDPWFLGLMEADKVVHAATVSSDRAKTAEHLRALEALCANSAPDYVCLLSAVQQAKFASTPAQMVTAGEKMIQLATRSGEFQWRLLGAFYAAEGERLRQHPSAARGYYEELILSSEDCQQRQRAADAIALMEFSRHRYAVAAMVLAAQPPCDTSPGFASLTLQGDMLEAGLQIDQQVWRSGLRAAAARSRTTGERMFLEYLGLRADLAIEPQARGQLRELIARASAIDPKLDEMAKRAKVGAEIALFLDAVRQGSMSDALEIAATAHAQVVPHRCTLALAQSGPHVGAVMVGADAKLDGMVAQENEWALPVRWQQALTACDAIEVLAFPPVPRKAPLPPTLPWAYRTGAATLTPAEGPARAVVIANSKPPASLGLAPLAPLTPPAEGVTLLDGPSATRKRVEAEAKDATLLEFHVHTAKVDSSDAPALALSEAAEGWDLSAEHLESWRLARRPVVLLADCGGAVAAAYDHAGWGLPSAFRKAGARAVVAALTDVPDSEAGRVFSEIGRRLATEPNVAKVVAAVRSEKIVTDPTSWVQHIVVFE